MRARRPQRVQIERPRFLQQRRRIVEEGWDERLARVIVGRHFWVNILAFEFLTLSRAPFSNAFGARESKMYGSSKRFSLLRARVSLL